MSQSKKYRVVIVEPSIIVSQGLKSLFENNTEFEIINTLSGTSFCLERLSGLNPDIILLNPVVLDFQKRLSVKNLLSISNKTALIAVVYNFIDAESLRQYDGSIDIYDDQTKIFKKLKHIAEQAQCNNDNQDNYDLTDREIEILISAAKGLTNKEIANIHNISVYTVISHRKNIARKTGIKSVSGLTVYALLNNLIDQSDIE